ncbi:hypothetical protein FRB96_002462 [Tulasnella sp. 330]|nr:hypothetical protein FRB96_002462 [Tulasnella sp. 330]KAG8877984.1 hypothetical protein FRB97_002870 [Tulasnella sp. 331]KAG8889001.1 hypothetical protein FRB98_006265 [Tulasnella sp. 332]
MSLETPQKQKKLRPVTARYVQEKLKYRLNELLKVAGRSKAAEVRKAQKESGNAARLSTLQKVDHDRIACSVLYKRITKVEGLAQEQRIAEALTIILPEGCRRRLSKPASKDEVDVEARITNNKHFQDQLKTAVEHLMGLAAQPLPAIKPKQQASSSSSGPEDEPREWTGVFGGSNSSVVTMSDGDKEDGTEMSDLVCNLSDEEEGSMDDDGWESGSVDEAGQVVSSEAQKLAHYHEDGGDDDSNSDNAIDLDLGMTDISDVASESSASKDEMRPFRVARRATNKSNSQAKAGESIFLPSLSVGFMPGEKDPYDDFENADIDGPCGGAIKRKNRRGQKARRAIWEKKYGSKAKHRQKEWEQWEQEMKRKTHLKATRLAERQARQKPGASSHQEPTLTEAIFPSEYPRRNRPNTEIIPQVTTSKRIHPAWEAKLKIMQRRTALMTTQPQGKKIVFK